MKTTNIAHYNIKIYFHVRVHVRFRVVINGDDDVDEDGLIDEMIFLGILNSMQAMPRPPSLGNFSQPLLLLRRTESW